MEVNNARIKNVTVELNDRDHLSVKLTFESQLYGYRAEFMLNNPRNDQLLVKLMKYTGVVEVKKMKNKVVRIVTHDNCFFLGFGDPIEDKFIPAFGEELKELTEAQFEELLNSQ